MTIPGDAQTAGSGTPSCPWLIASTGNVVRQMSAAAVAPSSCARMYGPTLIIGRRLVTKNPIVTAGLKCAPEMPPNAFTAMASANPCASAMPTIPAPDPIAGVEHKIAAMPAKHR